MNAAFLDAFQPTSLRQVRSHLQVIMHVPFRMDPPKAWRLPSLIVLANSAVVSMGLRSLSGVSQHSIGCLEFGSIMNVDLDRKRLAPIFVGLCRQKATLSLIVKSYSHNCPQ